MAFKELMEVPGCDRDLEWLKQSLQFAVELELATLPPYLTALWSINDGYGPAEAAITRVVKEEMLHMVLAGNMLSSLGERVVLTAPSYPGPLPDNVIPGLQIPLTRLSAKTLERVFMAIEFPMDGPVTTAPGEAAYDAIREIYDAILAEEFPTIGNFYAAISEAFTNLQPEQRSDFQLTGTVGGDAFAPTDTNAKAQTAIKTISEQGEGTSGSPFTDPDFGSELSHFYRFAEVFHGRRVIGRSDASGKQGWFYEGDPVPFPVVYPMAEVPVGGYAPGSPFDQAHGVSQAAQAQLTAFNAGYGQMLNLLEQAWAVPEDAADKLGQAVGAMFGLKGPAQQLMTMERPDGAGTYGPDWRAQR